jgi:hypothetical protein
MSFTVTDAFVQQFSGNVRMLAQQTTSRLRNFVIEDNITGDSSYMEQVAPTSARKVLARHSDSPIMNTQHLRRRISPYDYDWGDLVDKEDQMRLLIDPASVYARNAAAALQRGFDDEIINAFFSTAYTGHSGGTAITWPNGNSESAPTAPAGTQVAVSDWTYGNGSGNAGLTISKLISAMVALDAAEGNASEDPDSDEEERYCAIAAKQKGNLLATTEATLKEFGVAKDDLAPLRDGKIAVILGFKVKHTERLQLNGSSQTRVPAWRKSGMGVGVVKGISGQVAPRADKRFSLYVYADMSIGGSRLEEAKLVEIVCA